MPRDVGRPGRLEISSPEPKAEAQMAEMVPPLVAGNNARAFGHGWRERPGMN